MSQLQSVQNAATRLVTGTQCCDRITLVLCLLHWLSLRQHVDFKVPHLFIGCCPEILHHSYLPHLVMLLPTFVSNDYAPQRAGHASLPGPTAPLMTELLQLLVPGCGTVYRHISEMRTYRTVGCGGH